MNNLYVITIATDIYNVFIDNLTYSLKNLIPLVKYGYKLHLLVLSDNSNILESCTKYDEFSYILKHTANFPYPFNSLLKVHIIADVLQNMNIDSNSKFIFVDADSIFRKREDSFFERLDNCLKSNTPYFSFSPWRVYNPGPDNSEQQWNIYSCTHIDVNKYVNDRYVQFSFMMGSIEHIYELVNKMEKYFIESYKERRVPHLIDQSIVNKILSEEPNYGIVDKFIFIFKIFGIANGKDFADNYKTGIITCNDTYNIDDYPNIFVFQKYDTIKDSKRLD